MDSFIRKSFYTIGALKISRFIYLCGIRQKASSHPWLLKVNIWKLEALRIFISTNARLSTQEILDTYTKRWSIEFFFHQSKSKIALDKYQIRSMQGILRYLFIYSYLLTLAYIIFQILPVDNLHIFYTDPEILILFSAFNSIYSSFIFIIA